MYFAFPVWDAEKEGCTFIPSGRTVKGILPARGSHPPVVIESDNIVHVAIELLAALQAREKKLAVVLTQ